MDYTKGVVIRGTELKNLIKIINDMDYCFICDNHINGGHSDSCSIGKFEKTGE